MDQIFILNLEKTLKKQQQKHLNIKQELYQKSILCLYNQITNNT